MVQISVPINPESAKEEYFSFNVEPRSVMLAGSRNLELSRDFCRRVANELHTRGFGFFVGCAPGVDESFRKVLSFEPFKERSFVACAFPNRTKPKYTYGLDAFVVVPEKIPVRAALARRTVWMARRCQFLVLFPDDPKSGKWGKGSTLAFFTAALNLKPVFIYSKICPLKSPVYNILYSSFFGILPGYWVIPHTYKLHGTCEDEA